MKQKLPLAYSLLFLSNLALGNLLLWLPLPALAQSPITVPPANNQPIVRYAGPESSIKRFLCTPNLSDIGTSTKDETGAFGSYTSTATTNPAAGDLSICVNRLYRLAGAVGAFAGVFFIGLSGYYYILGGEHGKEKAKHTIVSVIVGSVIVFTAFIFLKQINPEAVKFKPIQPPQLGKVPNLPSCEALGLPTGCSIEARETAVKQSLTNKSGANQPNGGLNCCDIIAWSGADPYDQNGVQWSGAKAELKPAAEAAIAEWKAAGHDTHVTSAYRSLDYQQHSRSVWDAFKIICGSNYGNGGNASNICPKPGSGLSEVKGGYTCPSPEFDVKAPSDLTKYTSDKTYMDNLIREAKLHQHFGDTRPACSASDHTKGIGIDFNTKSAPGTTSQFQAIAKKHGLCRDISTDENHFVLISSINETETKKCIDF